MKLLSQDGLDGVLQPRAPSEMARLEKGVVGDEGAEGGVPLLHDAPGNVRWYQEVAQSLRPLVLEQVEVDGAPVEHGEIRLLDRAPLPGLGGHGGHAILPHPHGPRPDREVKAYPHVLARVQDDAERTSSTRLGPSGRVGTYRPSPIRSFSRWMGNTTSSKPPGSTPSRSRCFLNSAM